MTRWRSPLVLLFAVTVAVTCIGVTTPLVDPDVYWHVRMGQDIWIQHRFTGDPQWTFGPALPKWVTTQWGSEVLMAGLYHAAGWTGLTLLRAGCALATVAILARTLLRGPGAFWPRMVVFSLTTVTMAVDIQERPAALSFVFLAVLGGTCLRILRDQRWPRACLVLPATVAWANMHGYWILVPVAFAALVILLALTGTPWARLRHPTLLTAACAAAGLATPSGTYTYRAVLLVSQAATPYIEEWARTSIHSAAADAAALLLAVAVVSWARSSGEAVPPREVVWVLLWTGFALLAYRNVVPAALIVAPIIAERAAATWAPRWERPASRATVTLTLAVLLIGTTFGGARLSSEPRLPAWTPHRLYAALSAEAAEQGPRRVLVAYNLSGQALALTHGGIQVSINGRTDRYGAAYIGRYQNLMALTPGWQNTLAALHSTDALLARSAPLGDALRARGWRQVASDTRTVLLRAPASPVREELPLPKGQ